MAILTIENNEVRVEVDPHFGARVVSLIDRRSGRDWLAKGPQSTQIGDNAIYLANEAVGWDECFPTVAPWDAGATPLGRQLRDHGDLWGRPWTLENHSDHSLTLSWTDAAFRFTRRLSLEGQVLVADYTVSNISSAPIPFMWALHGLLAVTPGETIVVNGIDHVTATYISVHGITAPPSQLAWPGPDRATGIRLDAVQPASSHFAAKLYASHIPAARAAVGGRNGWLELAWDNGDIAHLGLWLNYGEWPQTGDLHHVALEPTTAPVDHLGQAIENGTASVLEAGGTKSWRVMLTLHAPSSSSIQPDAHL